MALHGSKFANGKGADALILETLQVLRALSNFRSDVSIYGNEKIVYYNFLVLKRSTFLFMSTDLNYVNC